MCIIRPLIIAPWYVPLDCSNRCGIHLMPQHPQIPHCYQIQLAHRFLPWGISDVSRHNVFENMTSISKGKTCSQHPQPARSSLAGLMTA